MRRLLWGLGFVAIACKGSSTPSPPPGVTPDSLTVTSTAFAAGASIPVDYTCDGKNIEPELAWSAVPAATKSIAIVVDDPDAPGGTFTHLVAFNVKADAREIAEAKDATSVGGVLGTNDFGKVGYGGPCPPKGSVHHYRFRVIAVDVVLSLSGAPKRSELDAALSSHVLGEGTLVGTFSH